MYYLVIKDAVTASPGFYFAGNIVPAPTYRVDTQQYEDELDEPLF